jgi:hypothetical protein
MLQRLPVQVLDRYERFDVLFANLVNGVDIGMVERGGRMASR